MGIEAKKVNWPRVLFVLACLTFIISGLFALDGRSRQQRLQTETGWPTVEARIDTCFVSQYHRVQSGSYRFYVHCSYSYTIDGTAYQSHTRTSSTTQSKMMTRMADWVRRHHKGQRQVIHYNPADPSQISLAGADHDIESQTAEAAYGAARTMVICGLGWLTAAFITTKAGHAADAAGLEPPAEITPESM